MYNIAKANRYVGYNKTMIRRIAHRFSAVLATAILVTVISSGSSLAQSTGLRINPRSDLVVKPGETQSATLMLSNLNKNVPITVDLSVVDFRSTDETGTPSLILGENTDPTPWSVKPFISIPASVDLAKGETKYIPYTIMVPQSQGAGSYYGAIKYDPRPSVEQETVVISGAPTQLVFVTVPGKATELMTLKEFGTYSIKDGESKGNFVALFTGGRPQKLAYLLENRGNVAESPSGSVIIKNIFGKTVKAVDNANPKASIALIGQTRRFEVCIESSTTEIKQDGRRTAVDSCKEPSFGPGMYRAELVLYYGINGSTTQEIHATTTFWYLPGWFIGVIVLILAGLAYVLYRVRIILVGRKKHHRQR